MIPNKYSNANISGTVRGWEYNNSYIYVTSQLQISRKPNALSWKPKTSCKPKGFLKYISSLGVSKKEFYRWKMPECVHYTRVGPCIDQN